MTHRHHSIMQLHTGSEDGTESAKHIAIDGSARGYE